jgi:hypothetical protein
MSDTKQAPSFISNDQLSRLAGPTRYQQALDSLKSLPVSKFEGSDKNAKGLVDGYQVSIRLRPEHAEGECNCTVSDGFDFCHHCVILCIHANKAAQQIHSLSKGPDKSKILAYLLKQDKQTLAKHCLDLINNDPEQFERYLLKTSLNQTHIDYSLLKAQITELTRTQENLFSQRQVKHFFAKVERFMEELSLIEDFREPEKMLKVVEYAYQRINRLLISIDDSSEHRAQCVELLGQMHQSLMMSITGRADTKAKRFYNLWMSDQFELLSTDLTLNLAPESLQKFQTLIKKAWESNEKTKKNGQDETKVPKWLRYKMARYFLDEAITANDQDSELHFRRILAKI